MVVVALNRRRLARAAGTVAAVALALSAWIWRPAPVVERPVAVPAGTVPAALRPVYAAQTTEKVVALTFDISWGQQTAPKVLGVLKRRGIKATFFLSGPWSQKHPQLVQRIVADGHDVQSHGQRHDNFSGLGSEGVKQNIQSAHAILKDLAGREPRFIRPPNGDFSAMSLQAAREVSYETIIWSVDSLDWKNPGAEYMTGRVLGLTHPGAIILMHASDSSKQIDQALPAILDGLQQRGYQAVTLTELLSRYPVDPSGHIRVPGRR